jgi:hypothetical protein
VVGIFPRATLYVGMLAYCAVDVDEGWREHAAMSLVAPGLRPRRRGSRTAACHPFGEGWGGKTGAAAGGGVTFDASGSTRFVAGISLRFVQFYLWPMRHVCPPRTLDTAAAAEHAYSSIPSPVGCSRGLQQVQGYMGRRGALGHRSAGAVCGHPQAMSGSRCRRTVEICSLAPPTQPPSSLVRKGCVSVEWSPERALISRWWR